MRPQILSCFSEEHYSDWMGFHDLLRHHCKMLHSRPNVECLQFDVTFESTLERKKLFLRNRMKTKLFFSRSITEKPQIYRIIVRWPSPVSFLTKQVIPWVSILASTKKYYNNKTKTLNIPAPTGTFPHYLPTHLQACSSFRFSSHITMQRMVTFDIWSPPRSQHSAMLWTHCHVISFQIKQSYSS